MSMLSTMLAMLILILLVMSIHDGDCYRKPRRCLSDGSVEGKNLHLWIRDQDAEEDRYHHYAHHHVHHHHQNFLVIIIIAEVGSNGNHLEILML